MLRERGIELVSRLNKAHRKADFRKGTRLSKEDHLVYWRKPPSIRSLDWESYKAMPDALRFEKFVSISSNQDFVPRVLSW